MADTTEEMIREALREGRYEHAVGIAIRGYGEEVLGFLVATTRNETDAREVFSQCCEDLLRGVRGFRGEGAFRAWMYTLARNAAHRHRRDPYRRRGAPLSDHPELARLEAAVRSSTLPHLRTEVKDAFQKLREELDPEDQELLILRVDRKLDWNEVALVFLGEQVDEGRVRSRAAALRKRFERVKKQIYELAVRDGLIKPEEASLGSTSPKG